MIDFEEEFNKLKQEVVDIKTDLAEVHSKVDSEVDTVLAKVQKSSVSWLIILGYTAGAVAVGAILF